MKILFDPVYTNRPSTCSTSFLVWELIDHLIKHVPDVYFYVTYPESRCTEADMVFLSKHPDRVTLIPVEAEPTDRVSNLFTLPHNLLRTMNPWHEKTWDADYVISSRIPMLGMLAPHFSRSQGKSMRTMRGVFGLEEMPFLPFRDTVPWSDAVYGQTLMAYALCDGVLINNQWTRDALRPVLRDTLSPAYAKKVLDNLHEVNPIRLTRLNLKQVMPKEGDDLPVTFVGRVTNTRNFQQVADLFRKQFSFPVGKGKSRIKFSISTNSQSTGSADYGEVDFIDWQFNGREKFYEFLDSAAVCCNLTHTEDFSLSTWETLVRGVPVIVLDYDWNKFLGPDYPFRVKTQTEAYAMVNAFAADYEGMYAKFRKWEETYWAGYVAGPKNISTGERLVQLIAKHEERKAEFLKRDIGKTLRAELKAVNVGKVLNLQKMLDDKNVFKLSGKPEWFSIPLARANNTLMLKCLAELDGWKDTNTTGQMVK